MSATARRSLYNWNELIRDVSDSLGKMTGNVMAEKQRPMIESRMRRRLMDLKLSSPEEYRDYWESNRELENRQLINLLTTHFTSFFREFAHFEWIEAELPRLVASAKAEGRTSLTFWSAACSKGQEVWSLCMWLNYHMPRIAPGMGWSVLGSDIDTISLKEGENGVYHRREIETAPKHLWEGQWLRGKGDICEWYKIKADLKKRGSFLTQNLLDLKMPTSNKFDVILVRNVLIYFDRTNQERAVNSLLNYLQPQGALITGLSESLNGYGLDLKGVAPSIYKRGTTFKKESKTTDINLINNPDQLPRPLKVFCIDDSSTVITIIKKILKEPDFQIIGTASDGVQAIEKLGILKPDVITLDLHMPVMDGPTFLKTLGVATKTPVIVLSSVDRADNSLVDPLFHLGICDFVEKPTLANMVEIGEELGQKLKMGWLAKKKQIISQTEIPVPVKLEKRPEAQIIFNFSPSDLKNLTHVLQQQKWKGDDLVFIVNGPYSATDLIRDEILPFIREAQSLNIIQTSDCPGFSSLPVVWLHFKGGGAAPIFNNKRTNHSLITEENNVEDHLNSMACDISPVTSFSYLIDKLLGGK